MLAKASPSIMNAVIVFCCGGFTEEDKMEEVIKCFSFVVRDVGGGGEIMEVVEDVGRRWFSLKRRQLVSFGDVVWQEE